MTPKHLCLHRQHVLEIWKWGLSLHHRTHQMLQGIFLLWTPWGTISEGKLLFPFQFIHLFVHKGQDRYSLFTCQWRTVSSKKKYLFSVMHVFKIRFRKRIQCATVGDQSTAKWHRIYALCYGIQSYEFLELGEWKVFDINFHCLIY